MNYRQPQLRSALAAEYAMGLLRGKARARFEKLLRRDTALVEETAFWNDRLADLAHSLPPSTPRQQVWQAIEAQLHPTGIPTALAAPLPTINAPVAPAANDASYTGLWRIVALAATVAAVALGTGWYQEHGRTQQREVALSQAQSALAKALDIANTPEAEPYVAVFAPADGGTDMRWAVSLHPGKKIMRIVCSGHKPMPMDPGMAALELWMIPANGKPHSLGVLPTLADGQSHDMPLPPMPEDEMGMAVTLAVSAEPSGGSPTGQPTGRVLGAFAAAKAI